MNRVQSQENNYLYSRINRLLTGDRLRVLDLFAGCGGMSLGFNKAGYKIVGGVEINPEAVSTHAKLFNDSAQAKLISS